MFKKFKNENPLILNIAAANILPIFLEELKNYYLINLDLIYLPEIVWAAGNAANDLQDIENDKPTSIYINHDVYDFLWRWIEPFDIITIYRFLEHVPRTKVLEFIYQLSRVTESGALIDIVVPDYQVLAKRILDEKVFDISFPADDIITSTELLNEPDSPHQSIWTTDRIKYFFELEGRFKVLSSETPFNFDGRRTHLRSIIERI